MKKMKPGMDKVRRFRLSTRTWLSNSNNLALVALIVAIISLIYTGVQVSFAKSALEVSRADLEARTRPYLSIQKIRLGNTDYGWISTNITINNLGETPATRVQFGEISLDGKPIAGNSQPDEHYPARTYTVQDGVTITITEELVVTPVYLGLSYDMIFFPQKPITIELLTCGSIQMSAIAEGSIIDISLNYSWGDKEYEYLATAVMSNGEWRVKLEREY
ncbi:MAG: hypothetical protein ACOC6O_02090 [Chloroflexota bacterium]